MQLRLFERNSCVHPHSEISVGISANSKVDTPLVYWFSFYQEVCLYNSKI